MSSDVHPANVFGVGASIVVQIQRAAAQTDRAVAQGKWRIGFQAALRGGDASGVGHTSGLNDRAACVRAVTRKALDAIAGLDQRSRSGDAAGEGQINAEAVLRCERGIGHDVAVTYKAGNGESERVGIKGAAFVDVQVEQTSLITASCILEHSCSGAKAKRAVLHAEHWELGARAAVERVGRAADLQRARAELGEVQRTRSTRQL